MKMVVRRLNVSAQVSRCSGLVAMSVAMLFAHVGCEQPPGDAVKQVADAERDFRSQNYPSAEAKLTQFIQRYPKSPEAAEAYYLRSLCNARRSSKVAAEADARSCLRLSKDKLLTANAHATIATLCFEANRNREAIDHFAAALAVLPDKAPSDLLRFRYATCLQREGRWAEAKAEFNAVCNRYPGSDLGPLALRMTQWQHDAFSIQCGAFREKSAAVSLEKKIRQAGLKAWVEQRSRSGEVLHTVYAGNYPSYAQARDALPRVQRSAPGAHIVP